MNAGAVALLVIQGLVALLLALLSLYFHSIINALRRDLDKLEKAIEAHTQRVAQIELIAWRIAQTEERLTSIEDHCLLHQGFRRPKQNGES